MFVREKRINGYTYLYLVETVQEDWPGPVSAESDNSFDHSRSGQHSPGLFTNG